MRSAIYKYRGESFYSYFGGFGMLGLLLFFGIAVTLKGNIIGIAICVAIVALIIFLISRFIKKVEFFDDNINITYMLNKQIEIPYSNIRLVYYNKEGFLPAHVYVIKYHNGNKIKKATFHCSENDFINVAKFLNEKGVNKIHFEQI